MFYAQETRDNVLFPVVSLPSVLQAALQVSHIQLGSP